MPKAFNTVALAFYRALGNWNDKLIHLGPPDPHEFSLGSLTNIVKHYSTFQQSLITKPQSTKET